MTFNEPLLRLLEPTPARSASSTAGRAIIGVSMMPGWTEFTLTGQHAGFFQLKVPFPPGTSKPTPRYLSIKEETTCAKYFLPERLSVCSA